jgi:ADP-heptose:LPS heptosyltransferase
MNTLDILRRDVRRIVVILPCCLGDVVLGTAVLPLLRRHFPDASLTWAVNSHSAGILEHHPALDDLLPTGEGALPFASLRDIPRFASVLRAGKFDLAVSLVRSPRMTAAVALSGIKHTAGLNSGWRGLAYRYRANLDPRQPEHEMRLYLRVLTAMGIDVPSDTLPPPPLRPEDAQVIFRDDVQPLLRKFGGAPYVVVHPGGGKNPGANMPEKRYPIDRLLRLLKLIHEAMGINCFVVVGGTQERELNLRFALLLRVQNTDNMRVANLTHMLTFTQLAALMAHARLYIGNDTGLTHYAAATGAPTVMLMGPTDPRRYAPQGKQARAVYRPTVWLSQGVSAGIPLGWTWDKEGITPEEALKQILGQG